MRLHIASDPQHCFKNQAHFPYLGHSSSDPGGTFLHPRHSVVNVRSMISDPCGDSRDQGYTFKNPWHIPVYAKSAFSLSGCTSFDPGRTFFYLGTFSQTPGTFFIPRACILGPGANFHSSLEHCRGHCENTWYVFAYASSADFCRHQPRFLFPLAFFPKLLRAFLCPPCFFAGMEEGPAHRMHASVDPGHTYLLFHASGITDAEYAFLAPGMPL